MVSCLAGDGEIWQEDQLRIKARIDLVQGVAPHAQQAVLLDQANKPAAEVQTLEERLSAMGLAVHWLPVVELENLWLEPAVVEVVLKALANAAHERGHPVVVPQIETITEDLAGNAPLPKGSDILKAICSKVPLRFDKKIAAEAAVGCIQELAPAKARRLKTAVESAFG